MTSRWLFLSFALCTMFLYGLASRGRAQNTGSSGAASVEERLAAIEGKLQLLENRLDQALGNNGQKINGNGNSEDHGLEAPVGERLEYLDQKLRILERRRELELESTAAKLKEAPLVSAGKNGFVIRSADSAFQLKLGGYIQSDSRFFTDRDQQKVQRPSTFVLRRIRPIFQGTVYKYFDFRLMPDFGNGQTVIQDAYLDLNYLPGAKVRFGKFKPPVGLERLQSGSEILFVERGFPTDLVPNRDVGFQIFGENLGSVFNYAVGLFNGVPDGENGDSDTNETKDFAGRVFVNPFGKTNLEPLKGLGVGLGSSVGSQQGLLPVLRSEGQAIIFNYTAGTLAAGTRRRLSPQAYYYWNNIGLLGEYVQSLQDVRKGTSFGEMNNRSWQVAGSYVLTGEKASYRGVTPARLFDPRTGQFGALELAARYSQLSIDNDAFILNFADPKNSISKASTWTVGLNWYFSRNLKFVVNYEQSHFRGGGTTGDRATEKVLLSRFQVAF